ncbi:unnamed protein product [Linum tenue]|nr:unnamed protein product [Linum tenue]
MRYTGEPGVSNVLHCYKGQVFVGRDGALEVWSRVHEKEGSREFGEVEGGRAITEDMYRRNYVDKVEDSAKGIIRKIEGGGNRLFVSREDVEGIEVWESSNLSDAVAVSS